MRNSKRRMKIIMRQTRSQNSRAFTELEIGDVDLEKTKYNNAMDTMIRAPATTEDVEKEKNDAKQEAKSCDNCRKEEGCPSYYDEDTRWNINHDKERSD
jgi:hypothetical protein